MAVASASASLRACRRSRCGLLGWHTHTTTAQNAQEAAMSESFKAELKLSLRSAGNLTLYQGNLLTSGEKSSELLAVHQHICS